MRSSAESQASSESQSGCWSTKLTKASTSAPCGEARRLSARTLSGRPIAHSQLQPCTHHLQLLILLDVAPQRWPVGLRFAVRVELAVDQHFVDQVDPALAIRQFVFPCFPGDGDQAQLLRRPAVAATLAGEAVDQGLAALAAAGDFDGFRERDTPAGMAPCFRVYLHQPEQEFEGAVLLRRAKALQQIIGAAAEDTSEPAMFGKQPAAQA